MNEYDDLLISNIRTPKLEDKLFIRDEDWWMNARLDIYHDPTELYIIGYKEAADLLVETVAEQKGTADSLIFPIVFIYRHYIEIRLKSLLIYGYSLQDKEYKQKSEHSLFKLWEKVRELLIEIFPNEDNDNMKAIDLLIKQIEEVDPGSTSFRYPKDFKGNNSLQLDSIPRVNLRNLSEVIDAISVILEGAVCGISEYQGYKSDMQSEYDWY